MGCFGDEFTHGYLKLSRLKLEFVVQGLCSVVEQSWRINQEAKLYL